MSLIKIDASKASKMQAQAAAENRRLAYQQEADPLFFKYQRGEVDQQMWLDKISEIKARYPDPLA